MGIFGGYDRNAAMQGQSGFAPMNQGFTPPAMNAPQKKPGFFGKGGGFVDLLGAVGDVFSPNGPMYYPQKQQQQRLLQQQQQAEQQRQQEREDFVFEQNYKRENPVAPQPTEFERILQASGLPQEQQIMLMQDYARNRANPVQGVPYTDEQGNSGLQFIRPGQMQGGGQTAPPKPVGRLRPIGGQPAGASPFVR